MQVELQELQPKLIETSRETEELISIIEKETIEVEAVKKVVQIDEDEANKRAMEAKAIKVIYALQRTQIIQDANNGYNRKSELGYHEVDRSP